jgi:hypothetical protein
MSCERFREALSRHAAGDGIDGVTAAHLEGCRDCAARLGLQRRLLAEVDAELERALAFDASPELISRVIARSRSARDAAAWRFRGAWAGLAAAAALAIGVYLRAPVDAPAPSRPAEQTAAQQALPAPASTDSGDVPAVGRRSDRRPAATSSSDAGRAVSPRSRSVGLTAAKSPAEPEVLVHPDQVRAIARLRELLREGRLTEQMLPPVRPHEPAELSVVPLQIPDIAIPTVDSIGHVDAASRERQ